MSVLPDVAIARSSPRPYLVAGVRLVDRYEILREIGRGGFSAVYAARDHVVGEDVAVKLLVPPPAAAERARERMRREVQVVRQLSHYHIVAVHDFVDDGDRSFIVMRLIEGQNLAEHVRDRGPMTAVKAARLGAEIAAALVCAHRRGVLHRDVKPQNILIDGEGRALLTDFGSARMADRATLAGSGTLVGTLGYVAPNVLAGARADARDDLFALGMTLFFALTGESGRSEPGGAHPRVLRRELPAWLDSAIATCTAEDPSDRVQTAFRLAEVLTGNGSVELVAEATPDEGRCVVCGDLEPMGAIVCDFCSGASAGSADTLVIVRGDERATARVPSAAGDRAVVRLQHEGKRAIAVPARLAWTAIPLSSWLLAVLVLLTGYAAAGALSLASIWQPLLLSTILLWSAERTLRTPQPRRNGRTVLPAPVHDAMVGVLSTLPRGSVRSLHAGLSNAVRGYFELATRHETLKVATETVSELYLAACIITRDLAELDRLLDHATREPDSASPLEASLETLAILERAREAHVQCLLEAADNVRRVCRLALDPASDAATDAVAALGAELERQREAIAETEALLTSRSGVRLTRNTSLVR